MNISAIFLRLLEIDNYHATSSRLEQIRGTPDYGPSGAMQERIRLAPYRAIIEYVFSRLDHDHFLIWLAMEIGIVKTEKGFIFFDTVHNFRPNDIQTSDLYDLPLLRVQTLFRESRTAVLDAFYSSQLFPPFDEKEKEKSILRGHRNLLDKLKDRQ